MCFFPFSSHDELFVVLGEQTHIDMFAIHVHTNQHVYTQVGRLKYRVARKHHTQSRASLTSHHTRIGSKTSVGTRTSTPPPSTTHHTTTPTPDTTHPAADPVGTSTALGSPAPSYPGAAAAGVAAAAVVTHAGQALSSVVTSGAAATHALAMSAASLKMLTMPVRDPALLAWRTLGGARPRSMWGGVWGGVWG